MNWLEIMNLPKFDIGEIATLREDLIGQELGTGDVTITETKDVPITSLQSVGHPQWLKFTKEVNGNEMVYDGHQKQYVLPLNLSEFAKQHPTTISGGLLIKKS